MALTLRPSLNWLLAAAPAAVLLEHGQASPPAVFAAAALAIVPLARLIVVATESLAERTGPAAGGLLNASFGNLPELIIAFVALRAGLFDMVRASLVGALLANLLLALGFAFLLGGLRHHEQTFSAAATQTYASTMLLAVLAMGIPAAFHRFFGAAEGASPAAARLDIAIAAVLLVVYGLYLILQLRTHPDLFASTGPEADHGGHASWSVPFALAMLVVASGAAAWMSEVLVGAAEETGRALGLSDMFIGLIVLAVVGGAAESLSAIAAGRANKVDLALGIAFGSCIQISLLIAPLLVLVSRVIGPGPFALAFSRGEIGALLFAVLIGTVIASGGRSHWFKGVQLLLLYFVFAAVAYLIPSGIPAPR